MPKRELIDGTFICDDCGRRYELRREPAEDAVCGCGDELVEDDGEEEEETALS